MVGERKEWEARAEGGAATHAPKREKNVFSEVCRQLSTQFAAAALSPAGTRAPLHAPHAPVVTPTHHTHDYGPV